MGGMGSGTWQREDKKSTVEESVALGVSDFRDRFFQHSAGTLTRNCASGSPSSIRYAVNLNRARMILALHYRWRDGEDVLNPILLQSTPTQFSGKRWWFTCPLVMGGEACNRRVGNLYLPLGAKYFGCRICYGLAYRSSQQAHIWERLCDNVCRERWRQFVLDHFEPVN